ncbi:MAG: hypothetical protein HY861_04930 [Chlamydiia bacterium]|nr:hypothetical protein [Chlamydiia bacterium]
MSQFTPIGFADAWKAPKTSNFPVLDFFERVGNVTCQGALYIPKTILNYTIVPICNNLTDSEVATARYAAHVLGTSSALVVLGYATHTLIERLTHTETRTEQALRILDEFQTAFTAGCSTAFAYLANQGQQFQQDPQGKTFALFDACGAHVVDLSRWTYSQAHIAANYLATQGEMLDSAVGARARTGTYTGWSLIDAGTDYMISKIVHIGSSVCSGAMSFGSSVYASGSSLPSNLLDLFPTNATIANVTTTDTPELLTPQPLTNSTSVI